MHIVSAFPALSFSLAQILFWKTWKQLTSRLTFRLSLYFKPFYYVLLEFMSCLFEYKKQRVWNTTKTEISYSHFVKCYMRKQMMQRKFLSLIAHNLDPCHFNNLMVCDEIWDLYFSRVICSISGVHSYSKFGYLCCRDSSDTHLQKWDVKIISPHILSPSKSSNT